eukprot:751958-Hanusia_phi.AAC.3
MKAETSSFVWSSTLVFIIQPYSVLAYNSAVFDVEIHGSNLLISFLLRRNGLNVSTFLSFNAH